MMLQKLNNEFHKKAFGEYEYDVKALGWGSKYSQEIRFDVMKNIGINTNDSVLDVGCGFGDFYTYLKNFNLDTKYTGIDINSNFIKKAIELEDLNSTFKVGNISSVSSSRFDWVVASGIFSFDCKHWEEEMCGTMKEMFDIADKGICANFLSAKSSYKFQDGFRHSEPEYIISKLVPILSNRFVLRHDYKENDFTLYFYKKDTK